MASESTRKQGIVRSYATSELFEILAAAVLGIGIIPAGEHWYIVLAISLLLFLLALFLRLRGGAIEASAEKERKERDHVEMHVVTAERLRTLEVVDAGEDVIEALKPLLGRAPMPAEELIRWLKEELGHVRAQEKLEVVRRYTLTERLGETVKSSLPEERAAAGSQERGPTIFDPVENPASGSP